MIEWVIYFVIAGPVAGIIKAMLDHVNGGGIL